MCNVDESCPRSKNFRCLILLSQGRQFFFLLAFSFKMAQKNPKGGGGGPVTTTSTDSAAMFLKRGLEKLLSEKDIKKSQSLKKSNVS